MLLLPVILGSTSAEASTAAIVLTSEVSRHPVRPNMPDFTSICRVDVPGCCPHVHKSEIGAKPSQQNILSCYVTTPMLPRANFQFDALSFYMQQKRGAPALQSGSARTGGCVGFAHLPRPVIKRSTSVDVSFFGELSPVTASSTMKTTSSRLTSAAGY
jgi:hypothetical protein